jgi:hypothetical protein
MGSTFLFAMPSMLSGVGRTLDLGATFDSYNASPTPEEADRIALYLDWASVGGDLRYAMESFDESQESPSSEPVQLSIGLADPD